MTAAITGQETYRYDGHGRRTVRQGSTGERHITAYGRSGQLLYEKRTGGQASCAPANDHIFCHGFQNPSGPATSTRYVYLDHRLVAQHSGSTVTYLHVDQLGSVTMRTNAQRQVIGRSLYEPYGSLAVGQIEQGPGYTGHVGDAATQLHYMQARYYDPQAMRFGSPDPVYMSLIDGSGFNRYEYAMSNPYRYTDPDGEQSVDSYGTRREHCPGCTLMPMGDGKRAFVPQSVAADVYMAQKAGTNLHDYTTPPDRVSVASALDKASLSTGTAALLAAGTGAEPAAGVLGASSLVAGGAAFLLDPDGSRLVSVVFNSTNKLIGLFSKDAEQTVGVYGLLAEYGEAAENNAVENSREWRDSEQK